MKFIFILSFLLCFQLHGQIKTYFKNGNLKGIRIYNEITKKGQWEEYFITGTPYSISTINGNKREYTLFYENGAVREHGNYTNERKSGEWLKFDKNGCLVKVGSFKNGIFDGKIRRYHMDKPLAIEHYNDRKKTGKWSWYRNGQLTQIKNYKNDKAHGAHKSFFIDGNLSYERYYAHGTPIGIHKDYTELGIIKHRIIYENGREVEKRNYYPNGAISHLIVFSGNTKLEKGYHEIGNKLSHEGYWSTLENIHLQTGEWKYFYQNGKLHYKGKFTNGKRSGKWKGKHANGKRKFKGVYKDDERIGVWKYYDKNGKRKPEEPKKK